MIATGGHGFGPGLRRWAGRRHLFGRTAQIAGEQIALSLERRSGTAVARPPRGSVGGPRVVARQRGKVRLVNVDAITPLAGRLPQDLGGGEIVDAPGGRGLRHAEQLDGSGQCDDGVLRQRLQRSDRIDGGAPGIDQSRPVAADDAEQSARRTACRRSVGRSVGGAPVTPSPLTQPPRSVSRPSIRRPRGA